MHISAVDYFVKKEEVDEECFHLPNQCNPCDGVKDDVSSGQQRSHLPCGSFIASSFVPRKPFRMASIGHVDKQRHSLGSSTRERVLESGNVEISPNICEPLTGNLIQQQAIVSMINNHTVTEDSSSVGEHQLNEPVCTRRSFSGVQSGSTADEVPQLTGINVDTNRDTVVGSGHECIVYDTSPACLTTANTETTNSQVPQGLQVRPIFKEKKNQCSVCGMTFRRNNDLCKHFRIHTRPLP